MKEPKEPYSAKKHTERANDRGTDIRPGDSFYQSVFDVTPVATMVVDQNFRILDANRMFRSLYPRYGEEKNSFCYKVIPFDPRETPCPECMVRTTFISGKEMSAEERTVRDGRDVHCRRQTLPVYSAKGEITAVIQTFEDITEHIAAESQLERDNRELEKAIHQRLEEQREKEKKLTVIINTVYEIKGAHNIEESMDKITGGFRELGAGTIAFALFDNERMRLARVYPLELVNRLNRLFRIRSIMDLHVGIDSSPGNPLVHTSLVGKPVFYRGDTEIYNFFKECFNHNYDHEIAEAAYLFQGQSLVIFPLKTKEINVGTIVVTAATETLEQNFEFFSFLSSSAAVEIMRQRNSEKLLRSELKYRNLVERSRDMIILCSCDGKIKYSNPIFYELTGISRPGRRELNIFNFFNNSYKNRIREIISTGLDNNTPIEPLEMEMKVPGKKRLWTEMVINPVAEEFKGFQIVARDITQRKNLEHLVGNLSAFQEKILQNDAIGIITTDLAGNVTSWNRGAQNILGYSSGEMIDRDIRKFIITESPPGSGEFLKKKISSAGHNGRELKFRKKDGMAVDIMYVESAMKDEAGKPIAVIAFFFDNTAKIRLEEKWRELSFRLQQAQLITIVSLAKLAEYRDIETGLHLERIMKYTETLARELADFTEYRDYITEEYITDLVNSCPLHDIGKVGIPDSILHKPARLNTDEFEIIKKHSVIGGDTIAEAEKKVKGRSYLNLGKEIAYFHHERWDGSGYPQGLSGSSIPLSARIVAVSDVYDALISKRPYKEPYAHEVAVDIITRSANSHFDETVVRAFLNREQEISTLSRDNLN